MSASPNLWGLFGLALKGLSFAIRYFSLLNFWKKRLLSICVSLGHGAGRIKLRWMGPTVFIVDCEPGIAFSLTEILRLHGYEALPLNDLTELLAAAEKHPPDLVVADHLSIEGIGSAIAFKTRFPSCGLVLITTRLWVDDLVDSLRSSGCEIPILRKPVPPTELLACIEAELLD